MYAMRRVYRPLRTSALGDDIDTAEDPPADATSEPAEDAAPADDTSTDVAGEGPSVKTRKFLFLKKVSNYQLIDGTSAFLSFVALCIAIWRMRARPRQEYLFEMTEANNILAPRHSPVFKAIMPAVGVSLEGVCAAGGAAHSFLPAFAKNMFLGFWLPLLSETPYKVSHIETQYDDEAFVGTTLTMNAGQYDPMSALVWIFTVSVAFQGARVWLFVPQGNRELNNKAVVFSQYRPYAGPDFWRWVEYALTSPFQVVIIASSFGISDRSLLLALGGLQGALTILGVCIEQQIRKLGRHRAKLTHHSAKARKRSHMLKAVILLWSAWALHGVIWFVLLERFERQKDNLVECGYKTSMPSIVNVIVFGEFLLFTLFGLVPSVQLGLVITTVNTHDDDQANPPDIARWGTASMVYGILSVAAKTLLEYGFILLVETTPNVQRVK